MGPFDKQNQDFGNLNPGEEFERALDEFGAQFDQEQLETAANYEPADYSFGSDPLEAHYDQVLDDHADRFFPAYGRMIPKVPDEDLIDALYHETPAVRAQAANALGARNVADAVPAISHTIAERNRGYRFALLALADLGELANDAVPTVAELLRTARPSMAYKAARTLRDIGTQDAFAAIGDALPELDDSARANVLALFDFDTRQNPNVTAALPGLQRAAELYTTDQVLARVLESVLSLTEPTLHSDPSAQTDLP